MVHLMQGVGPVARVIVALPFSHRHLLPGILDADNLGDGAFSWCVCGLFLPGLGLWNSLFLTLPLGAACSASECKTSGEYLRTLWSFFFFCLDIGFISSFGKLIIPDSYFMTSRAFVLVAWILFLPFSWLFSTCLTLPGIWLWLTFMYLCQDSPSPVGYHSACSYPAYLLFCLLVTPPIHYINRLPSLCIHSVRLIQSEWHPNVLPIDPSEVDQCVLLSWLMSSKYRWLYLLRPRQNIGRLCITLVNSTLDGDMCYCLGVGW